MLFAASVVRPREIMIKYAPLCLEHPHEEEPPTRGLIPLCTPVEGYLEQLTDGSNGRLKIR